MKVARWEIAVVVGWGLLSSIFLLSNTDVGAALLCSDALSLVTRVRIVERSGQPGRYARTRGRLGLLKTALILAS
jgi:hypothetical protein